MSRYNVFSRVKRVKKVCNFEVKMKFFVTVFEKTRPLGRVFRNCDEKWVILQLRVKRFPGMLLYLINFSKVKFVIFFHEVMQVKFESGLYLS